MVVDGCIDKIKVRSSNILFWYDDRLRCTAFQYETTGQSGSFILFLIWIYNRLLHSILPPALQLTNQSGNFRNLINIDKQIL